MCIQKFIQEPLAVPMDWQEIFSSYRQEVRVTKLDPTRSAIPIFFGKTSKTPRKISKTIKSLWLKRPHQRCFDRVVTTTLTIENEDCELAVATFC